MSATRVRWELPLLFVVAAAAALPDLFDLEVFKTSVLALLVAAVLLPWLLWTGRDDVGAWLSTIGARLLLFSVAWAALSSATAFRHAPVADRVLGVLLCQVAAVLGLRAAGRAPGAFAAALAAASLITAMSALLQAVGMDTVFPAGSGEIVALTGNTTRAGALLALGVVAAFAIVCDRRLDARDWRMRVGLGLLLLATCALVLTRARGGWVAAAGGLTAVALCGGADVAGRIRLWLPRLLLGVGLAVFFAPDSWHVLTARKLADQEDAASGAAAGDVTTQVRLSIARACLPMIRQQPLEGWGLGRFRETFPPFREPTEAALPGLGGAPTEVDHPHNELLLAFAEGGLPSGLALLAFVVLTLGRAVRRARATGLASDALVLGVLVAGTLAGLVQNAWTSPATALPLFAAAGWAWRPEGEIVLRPLAGLLTGAALLAAMAVLLVLALPRLDSHLQLRRFYRDAARHEVTLQNIPLLVEAADADPGDADVQRILLQFGPAVEAAAPGVNRELPPALQRARIRLAELAPHAAAGP